MPGAKVLVIDDDVDFRTSVRSMLEMKGLDVIEAESGCDGLQKLADVQPDLITVDIMMTCDTDGYGVSHAIRHRPEFEAYRHIPIIMISSIEQSPDELFPMSPEVELIRPDIYMTKPLDIPVFLDTVDRALSAAKS